MSKNAEGWIRHNNKKQPVDDHVEVEIRTRGGDYEVCKAYGFAWDATGEHQIMAYRLHKPAEQVAPDIYAADDSEQSGSVDISFSEPAIVEGPLQWRDRIAEIDATTKALTTERAELVQKLASEGFALIGRVVDPVEDMSDWRNWKFGDLVECISDPGSKGINVGRIYRITFVSDDSFGFLDDDGDHRDRGDMNRFKFHSRPSA